MKIVVLERNSVGTDIDVSCYEDLGEVTYFANTVEENTTEHIKDADIVIANKAPMKESTLKDCPNVKLICEFATGYDNVDLEYCRSRNIKVANVVDYSTAAVAQHTFALTLYVLEILDGKWQKLPRLLAVKSFFTLLPAIAPAQITKEWILTHYVRKAISFPFTARFLIKQETL